MLLFNKTTTACISLHPGVPDAIAMAAKSLQRDFRILSGHTHGFEIVHENETAPGSVSVEIEKGEPESYRIEITENAVRIVGGDTLGAVFGVYAFSGRVLGFSPMHPLTEVYPERPESLTAAPQVIRSGERRVKFRGWFLNDEDLLGDFRGGGGKRDIDYPFYQSVMRTDVLDMILECALRLEINLIIPSSFVNIDNPAEEALVEAVCRRGLYISQHHVEPMGVSYFSAADYVKKNGRRGETVSFITNRGRMEELWRYYAKKWAKYGDRVVWQLGLRGKADQAVWKADKNVPMSPEGRGEIISDAISTQRAIIEEALGHGDFHSTATLWMEGAALYGAGHLRIPADTAVIFSDIGMSQMFGDDFYVTERKPGHRYGIYYHIGFWGMGPHLAEGCDPHKMAFSYSEAAKRDSLYYSILNVSNLRPLHIGAELNARLLENPELSARTGLRRIFKPIFGDAADVVLDLYDEYFAAYADLGTMELVGLCNRHSFDYHPYGRLLFPEFPSTDGELHEIGQCLLRDKTHLCDYATVTEKLRESESRFAAVLEKMTAMESRLPERSREYFRRFIKFGAFYMMKLTRWTISVYEMMTAVSEEGRTAALETGVAAMESILAERRILEQGDFAGWHDGESKIGIRQLTELMRSTCERLREKRPL